MQSSRVFELKIKQAEKFKRNNPDFDLPASLNDSFRRIINVPPAMADEIFASFSADYEKLFVLIDLYNNDLDTGAASLLDADEWQLTVELTNRYAADIDLETLQTVMQFFLDINVLNT
jgi:hypothetical protein